MTVTCRLRQKACACSTVQHVFHPRMYFILAILVHFVKVTIKHLTFFVCLLSYDYCLVQ